MWCSLIVAIAVGVVPSVLGNCWPRVPCTTWAYSPPKTTYVKVPIYASIPSGCSSSCQGDIGGCESSCDVQPARTIERYIVRMRPRVQPAPVQKEFIIQEPIIQEPEPRPVVIRQPIIVHESAEQGPILNVQQPQPTIVRTVQQPQSTIIRTVQQPNYEIAPPVVRTVEEIKYENVGQIPQMYPSAGYSISGPTSSGYSISAPASGGYQSIGAPGPSTLDNLSYDNFKKFMRARSVRKEAARRQ